MHPRNKILQNRAMLYRISAFFFRRNLRGSVRTNDDVSFEAILAKFRALSLGPKT